MCVRTPLGVWAFVSCEYFMLSGRCICDELTTCSEESYRPWCIGVCDLETLKMRRPWPALGLSATDILGVLHPRFLPVISWLKAGNVCRVIQSINLSWIQHCKSTLASSTCPLWGRSVLHCSVKKQSDISVSLLLHIAYYHYILHLWHSMFIAFLFPSGPFGMSKAYICTYLPSKLAILSSSGQASNNIFA